MIFRSDDIQTMTQQSLKAYLKAEFLYSDAYCWPAHAFLLAPVGINERILWRDQTINQWQWNSVVSYCILYCGI